MRETEAPVVFYQDWIEHRVGENSLAIAEIDRQIASLRETIYALESQKAELIANNRTLEARMPNSLT